ncbi:hypothetical protein FOA43_001568 [Brettanomyces nanus]|uniref:DNA replication checkpoint mediator MRC1 domain-containing protein n=1 Tax=Eeniella nana TaxID=13502 RepID=A0A875S001_EENNA|nr:uncharacterized protein FOA43_001568 [Brettanomyces nanus]QPG74243.1 hypothetical protein FOA43_001568 [Brettanomyces nanus]
MELFNKLESLKAGFVKQSQVDGDLHDTEAMSDSDSEPVETQPILSKQSEFQFDQLSIFQNQSKENGIALETQEIQTEDKFEPGRPDFSALGLDSGVLDSIMNRLKGERVIESTQKVEKTQPKEVSEITQHIENSQQVEEVSTEVIPSEVVEKSQPLESTQALSADDDDIVVKHRRLVQIPEVEEDDSQDPEADISIENYKNMTREQKIEARIHQKEMLREKAAQKQLDEAKLKEEEDKTAGVPTVVTHVHKSKKTAELEKLADAVKQNELIRKSNYVVRKSDKSKFAPAKLLEKFNMDSDSSGNEEERLFSNDNHMTPLSSPKEISKPEKPRFSLPLGKYTEKLRQEADNKKMMICLDSETEDSASESPMEAQVDKKKVFDMKRRMSRKRKGLKPKKKTIKNLIREETLKQMKKFVKERRERDMPEQKQNVSDEKEIMKMMKEESERNKMIAQREREKEERTKMILEGNLPIDDELDESEDENEEADEEEEEEEEEDPPEENVSVTNETQVTTGNESHISFQPENGSVNHFKDMKMSFSDMFDQTLPQNKSFDGLKGVEVVRKLQSIQNKTGDTPDVSFRDDSNTSDWLGSKANISNVSFSIIEPEAPVTETKEESQLVEEKKRLLDSQNFLPKTQADDDEDSQDEGSDEGDGDERDGEINNGVGLRRRKLREASAINLEEGKDIVSSDNDEEVVYEDDETRKLRLMRMEEAKRGEKERMHALHLEFKEAGMAEILENEAVESEDEWQGIGGADGERSDQENSEDEKMLDDSTKIVVDEDRIRANLAQHDIQADDEMVKKIYRDLKTGAFRKRRAHDGAYELDLDDDEDDYMREFYEHRKKEYLQKQYQKDASLRQLSKNQSCRAFYETIATDSAKSSSFAFEDIMDEEEKKCDDPFRDDDEDEVAKQHKDVGSNDESDDNEELLIRPKKKRRLTAAQVRSMISFLDDDENEGGHEEEIPGLGSDDGVEEIRYIKEHSRVKVRQLVAPGKKPMKKHSSKKDAMDLESTQETGGENSGDTNTQPIDDDIDGGMSLLASRERSVAASFRHQAKRNIRYSTTTGHEVHEVTVTVGSRPTMHTKGSVTVLAAHESYLKNEFQLNSKAAKIRKTVESARTHSGLRRIYDSIEGFDE